MNCTDIREQLHDWLDGELPQQDIASLEAHLEMCDACRGEADALRELLAAADSLSASIEPSRDLWPGIHARLQATEQQQAGRHRKPVWLRAVAAGVLLVGVFYAGMLADRVRQPGIDPGGADQSGTEFSVADSQVADSQPDAMDRIPADLESAAARRALPRAQVELVAGIRDGSGADTEAVMLRNLLIVNLGIRQVEQALEGEPDNAELRSLLASLYEQENRLLRQAERMTSQGATRKRTGI